MTRYDVRDVVLTAVEETFGLPRAAFSLDLAPLADLGADSLSLVDLMFRLECSLPLLLSPRWCAERLQGAVPDDEFCDERGLLTPAGLAQLATVMPQISVTEWQDRLTLDRMLLLLTVGNLITLIEAELGADHCLTHA